MLADLAGGHADRTWGQRIREYTKPLVLILDDFAMREHTPTQSDDLYELISDRAVNGRPLILTSNRSPKKAHLFARTCVAARRNCTGPLDSTFTRSVLAGVVAYRHSRRGKSSLLLASCRTRPRQVSDRGC
jgi:hypothetical protein